MKRARGFVPTEAQVLRGILAYLAHEPRVLAWRNNTGAARLPGRGGKEQIVRFGVRGAADILGVLRPSGRLIALEVKRPGKDLESHQRAWGDAITAAGGHYACVHSIDEARAEVERAGGSER